MDQLKALVHIQGDGYTTGDYGYIDSGVIYYPIGNGLYWKFVRYDRKVYREETDSPKGEKVFINRKVLRGMDIFLVESKEVFAILYCYE